jgi:hypothetical protein
MIDFPLNQIVKSNSGWSCNTFEFDKINIGGLYLSSESYDEMQVLPFTEYTYRFYKRTKKIVISSANFVDYNYCALDLQYQNWKCLLCKKLNKISNPICFCQTYSKCWTPIDGVISGVLFSNALDFSYHLSDDGLSNIIL